VKLKSADALAVRCSARFGMPLLPQCHRATELVQPPSVSSADTIHEVGRDRRAGLTEEARTDSFRVGPALSDHPRPRLVVAVELADILKLYPPLVGGKQPQELSERSPQVAWEQPEVLAREGRFDTEEEYLPTCLVSSQDAAPEGIARSERGPAPVIVHVLLRRTKD
jgi:hypothetical protein